MVERIEALPRNLAQNCLLHSKATVISFTYTHMTVDVITK